MNGSWYRLNEICSPKQWKTIALSELSTEGYPVYGANGIIGYYSDYTHTEETLLVTCRGATCGELNICQPYSYVNGNAMALDKLDKEKVLIKYLYYYLKNRGFNDVISGSAQPQITRNNISKIKIFLPEKKIQQKIVDLLDKNVNLIDKRKSQIEALDQLTQSVFLEMFGDPVLNPKEWPKLTMPSFVSKEKYSIKRGPFGGALKKEIFVNQGYLVYEQHHAINNDFSMARYFISEEKFDELKAFEVKPNDLIISCSGTLGKIAEVPENAPKGIINQALLKLTLDKNKMNNTFFIHLFRNQGIQNILFGTSHGSGIKNFPPMSVVKSVEFICPPIDEQKKFETKFKQITKKRERFELSLKEIENLYNALMQRAFKGELFTEEKVPNL